MKMILATALIALSFTTGFTCSKNTPAPEAVDTTESSPAVEEVAPAETMPADAAPVEATPTPAEDQPTQ